MAQHSSLSQPAGLPSARLRALSSGLRGKGIGILRQNLDLVYDLAENLPPTWPGRDMVGRTDADVLPLPLSKKLTETKQIAVGSGEPQTIEIEHSADHGHAVFDVQVSLDRNEAGEVDGIVSLVTDVSDQRARERAVNDLLREVSHRSKNLLAIIQSLAVQTSRHTASTNEFISRFQGRLHALASAQDLVTDSDWRGGQFRPLALAQLQRLGHHGIRNVEFLGDNPLLNPNATLHLGLALHELAANAVLYGALARADNGTIALSAEVAHFGGAGPGLVVEWRETIVTPIEGEANPRFGAMVLERVVPLAVGGEAELRIADHQVVYRLLVPADQFEP